jgi:feruloyl esterase
MSERHLRPRPISVLGYLLISASAAVLAARASLAAESVDPAEACRNLARLTDFPVAATEITLAQFNPSGTTKAGDVALPDHCQVQGIINRRTGADGLLYGDRFEVRLPIPAQWNRRFMFQGGGGTEGAVPAATGTAGTASLRPTAAGRSVPIRSRCALQVPPAATSALRAIMRA